MKLWRGLVLGNRLLIEVDGNFVISRLDFLEFFRSFSLVEFFVVETDSLENGLNFLISKSIFPFSSFPSLP